VYRRESANTQSLLYAILYGMLSDKWKLNVGVDDLNHVSDKNGL
tara:strand:- start:1610 stop:1741 length:132 start_codon:yes stop_codon:yes gene_type:complete